jgi:hypothetical protein
MERLSDRELLLLTAQKVDGINDRLDTLNGSVNRTKDRVEALEGWRSKIDGALTAGKIMLGSGGVFAVLAWLIGWVR